MALGDDELTIETPEGAIAWSPVVGFIYDQVTAARLTAADELVLVVSDDRQVRGLTPTTPTWLVGLLRLDARAAELAGDVGRVTATLVRTVDRTEQLERLHARLAERVGDTGDQLAAVDVSGATDVAEMRARLRGLADRVAMLEAR